MSLIGFWNSYLISVDQSADSSRGLIYNRLCSSMFIPDKHADATINQEGGIETLMY